MITPHRALLRDKDRLYEVIDIFGVEYFYDDDRLLKQKLFDEWKEYLKADIALKNDQKFFFCKNIEEIEFEMVSTELVVSNEV